MPPPTPPHDRRSFKVAIICALPLEAEKVRSVFDTCWEDQGVRYGQAEGDQNSYTSGAIGKHNVVLAHMARMGSTSASAVAADLRHSFPAVKLALVVGICGVAPIHPNTKEEIVLGDIIVSTSVIQYDFGRQYPNGFQRKKEIEDSLGRANPQIQSFISMLQVRQNRNRLTSNLATLLHSESFQGAMRDAKYPGASEDHLFEASYIHRHRLDVSCDKCSSDRENCSKSCEEVGCEQTRLIFRNRHSLPQTKDLARHPDNVPFIHFGRFGSANTVMKSGEDRDRMAKTDEVTAFEMEGAGVWDQHPTVVIKAACDYADSHKNKDWQAYAAAMAATCLKVFLNEWASDDGLPSPVWHVPFDNLSGFVGRTNEIKRLRELISNSHSRRISSILGLGGIGKSRLALEVAFQNKAEYPHHSVFWIEASEQLTFERDVLEIGRALRIPGIGDDKADIKNLFKQRLSNPSTEKWLLIIDNADDEALWGRRANTGPEIVTLAQYLPQATNGSIIITTRSRGVATFLAGKEVIELGEMSPKEGVKIFQEALEKPDLAGDETSMLALTEKLAYLPLALIQAASFINMNQESVQTYLQLLDQPEEDIIKLLGEDFGDPSRYPNAMNPIATTWLISFDRIRKHHDLAAKVLSLMACLHEKNIPRSLLPEANSEINIIKAIGVLTGYSFVKRHARSDRVTSFDEFYDLHRLVQLAARNWLKIEGSLSDWTKESLKRVAELFPTRHHQYRGIWTIYLPHAQRICEDESVRDCPERYQLLEKMGLCFIIDGKYTNAVATHGIVVQWREKTIGASEELTLNSYNNLGEALFWKGDFLAAKIYLEKASTGLREALGVEHPSTLISMGNLASTYRNQGQWTQSEELGVQVMETRKRVLGPEHPSTLTSMANLASTYRNQGRWTQAEELEVQVMETRKRVLGPEHPDTLTSMGNLASTYQNQGRWTQAEELEVQVMETRERVLGPEHPDTLTSIANLASTYRNQGRWTQAEELEVQVMETSKRVLGPEHPDTLTSIANLASTFWNQGRWTQAEELGVQVMETRKRVLGPEHPSTLTSMANLATTYQNQGRWTQAEELEIQVMETGKRVLGPEHPSTLISMGNLASTYRNQGRWTQAEALGVQVMETLKRVLGPEHPDTLISMANLASTFWNQGRWTQAEELEVQVMETRKRVLGPEHPSTLTSMANLATTYRNQGRWTQAEELEVQVIEAGKRVLGPEHPSTLTSMGNLASTYRNQGRWTQAEELEVQVMETRKRVLGPEHPSTLTSMANLAYTLNDQGRKEEAMELMASCLKLRMEVLGESHNDTLSALATLISWLGLLDNAEDEAGENVMRMPGAWAD